MNLERGIMAASTVVFLCPCLVFATISQGQDMPKPGATIDKGNCAEYKHLFPEEYLPAFVDGFGGLIDPVSIDVVAGKPRPMLPSFVRYSEKNRGKYGVDANGMVTGGYKRGVGWPFPGITPGDKDFAAKLMWNYDGNYWYDDEALKSANFRKRKGERLRVDLIHNIETLFCNGRMFVPPTPLYETPEGIYRARMLDPLLPASMKGSPNVRYRYLDPALSEETFLYNASQRKIVRGNTGSRLGTLLGDVGSTDDWDGFGGEIPDFVYTFVREQIVLACFDNLIDYSELEKKGEVENLSNVPFPRKNWQERGVYVIDVKAKDPSKYPYGKKRLYIDKDNLNLLYAVAWDRQGKPWKVWAYVLHTLPTSGDGNVYLGGQYQYVGVDIQSGVAVQVFSKWKVNTNKFTPAQFSLNVLQQRGR
jgi:hypothetical protein